MIALNNLRKLESRFATYKIFYEFGMAILAMAILVSLFIQSKFELSDDNSLLLQQTDHIIWIIFTIDYVIRFILAENKKQFMRNNIIDLISILPFDTVFQGLRTTRLLRIIYLIRLFAYLNRFYKRLSQIITTNDFHHVLWFTSTTIFCGAIAISYIDDMDIGDALWWSFVTTTTVGYGDIAPQSLGGRIIAVFLMIIGIGFLSMLTGTIATFFIRDNSSSNYNDEIIKQTIAKLNSFQSLSTKDIDDIYAVLLALKKNEKNNK